MMRNCQKCGRPLFVGIPDAYCVCGEKYKPEAHQEELGEPSWVRFVALFKTPEDVGVGDTVARYAAMLGGELFKAWSKRIGLPCGCTRRQAEWNARWPYGYTTDEP